MQVTKQDVDGISDAVTSGHIRDILVHRFGWDMTNPSVQDTPIRFIKYLKEFHNDVDAKKVLGTPFRSEDDGMVIQSNIPFRMICEHHLLPATGRAAIGYVPQGFVVGLSKMARLVDAIGTEKPSLQEHIGTRIANLLVQHLNPRGVIVVIEAEHGCMACRGVNTPGVVTATSTIRGVLKDQPAARAEFLALAKVRS